MSALWTFNNHLLVFHRLKEEEDPMEVPLVFSAFWIQVHDLIPGFFSESMENYLVTLLENSLTMM
ncbi:hypothetical protein Goari_016805 [Gossypium aridum]|uniref:DUF4283 domain-containing protein n=1 Tax=Gossypium aridum TaxID=34290 RepID=A0A7J8WJL8_GOSAI|nr:hypothetical protein [Gossypium aridum]